MIVNRIPEALRGIAPRRIHLVSCLLAKPRRTLLVDGLLAVFLAVLFSLPSNVEGQLNRAADLNRRIEQARSLERLRQYDRAVVLFERVLQDDPDNRSALNGALRLYFRLEAYNKLIPLLETHIAKSPDDSRLRGRLAEALYGAGRDDEAEEQIRDMLERFPQSESAVSQIANLHLRREAYDRAIQTYLDGRKRLGNPEAFALALASVYTSAFEVPGAVREFTRWLTQQPGQWRIVNDRIDLLASIGSQELVEQALRAAVAEHRDSKDAQDLLGGFYLRSGKPVEALAAYREADRLDGDSGKYLVRYADWALREGHHKDAIATYRELIGANGSEDLHAEAYTGLALAYRKRGGMDDAAETYRQIIAQYPNTEFRDEAMSNLADLLLVHYRDAPRALAMYRSLLADASAPEYREKARFGMAECYVVMGSLEDAIVQYNAILEPEVDTTEAETRARTQYHLGEMALFQNRLDDALGHFRETADRYTGSPYANDALAWTILIAEGRQGGDGPLSDYIRSVRLRRQYKDQEALDSCKSFVEENAESPIADTVILDIGMLLEGMGKPFQAVAALQDLIERYPESRRVAAAHWRIAEIYETKIGDIPRALTEYETLLLAHPDHFRNDAARRKIRELTEDHPPMP
ncbi:MAG: tetratricopeptide repeat protein [Gemmatimonadetes bacterium]|nr:tetratricopeptide repeat protein [Gemmatimonadota bacterium]MYD25690.1 tetratricopeptide repeat protein [Gemmatimonadota bacterium]